MAEEKKLNVVISADASKLKKETRDAAKELDKLKKSSSNASIDIGIKDSLNEIRSMIKEYKRLTSEIGKAMPNTSYSELLLGDKDKLTNQLRQFIQAFNTDWANVNVGDDVKKEISDLNRELRKTLQLNIDTSGAQSSVNDVKRNITNEQLVIPITVDEEKVTKELDKLKRYSEKTSFLLTSTNFTPTVGTRLESLDRLESRINKLKSMGATDIQIKATGAEDIVAKMKSMLTPIEKIKYSLKDVSQKMKEFKDNSKKPDGLSNILKGIIGIRSAFGAIRKAISTYLSQNKELENKLNGIWYSLGSIMAPVLEAVANIFAKLIVYVDAFVKGLGFAGVDMSNLNKDAKETQKTLAGFDEIMNLSSDEESGLTNPFDYADADTKWVDKFSKLGEALSPIAKFITDTMIPFLTDNLLPILNIIIGGKIAASIINITGNISKVINLIKSVGIVKLFASFSQFAGVAAIITGICLAVKSLIDYLNDPTFANLGKTIAGIAVALGGVALLVGSWPVAIGAAVAACVAVLVGFWPQIEEFFDNILEGCRNLINKCVQELKNSNNIIYSTVIWIVEGAITAFENVVRVIKGILETIVIVVKGVLDGIIKLITGVFTGDWKKAWEGVCDIFKSVFSGLATFFTSIFDVVINTINWVIDGINAVIRGINSLTGSSISQLSRLKTSVEETAEKTQNAGVTNYEKKKVLQVAKFDVGTNYVPQDQLAYIHKGEAIIPAAYNDNLGNKETNSLLQQLISVVDSKDFKAYISSKDIGQTAVSYIQKQQRINGGSLI